MTDGAKLPLDYVPRSIKDSPVYKSFLPKVSVKKHTRTYIYIFKENNRNCLLGTTIAGVGNVDRS